MVDKSIEQWDETAWKTPHNACLACGHVADAASLSPIDTRVRQPQAGDATVCLECSHVMIFNADLTVREPTPDELKDITDDPDVQEILWAMAELRKTELWKWKHGKHR